MSERIRGGYDDALYKSTFTLLTTLLAASNCARRFIGVLGRESPISVNFAHPDGRIGERAGHAHPHVNITVEMPLRRRKRHARDVPFVKSRGVWT